jgi:hypothetical protein
MRVHWLSPLVGGKEQSARRVVGLVGRFQFLVRRSVAEPDCYCVLGNHTSMGKMLNTERR